MNLGQSTNRPNESDGEKQVVFNHSLLVLKEDFLVKINSELTQAHGKEICCVV